MPFASIYPTQPMKFVQFFFENWSSWKMIFFWFLVLDFSKRKNVLFFPNENQLVSYHLSQTEEDEWK